MWNDETNGHEINAAQHGNRHQHDVAAYVISRAAEGDALCRKAVAYVMAKKLSR